MIISGDISALLGDDDTKVATNSNTESAVATSSNENNIDVDTNINEKPAVATSSNAMFNTKEGV